MFVCVCVCLTEREKVEKRVKKQALVHSPDSCEQTPSKAKDEVSHVGAILLGGISQAQIGHIV